MNDEKRADEFRFICGQCGNEFGISYTYAGLLYWLRCKKCNVSTPVYPRPLDAIRHYKEQYGLELKKED